MDSHGNHTTTAEDNGSKGKHGHSLHLLLIGTALAAGAVIMAPYVLPAIGIGSTDLALDAMTGLHGTGLGTGLVGFINSGLNMIPAIGSELAKGGVMSAAMSGVIGIGGALLGRFIEKKQDGANGINWGKVIKYGALATSALIAMPSILSGVSVGLVYLASLASVDAAIALLPILAGTLGSMSSMTGAGAGMTGAAAVLPHLLTCGAALLAPVFSFELASGKDAPQNSAQRNPRTFALRLQDQRAATLAPAGPTL